MCVRMTIIMEVLREQNDDFAGTGLPSSVSMDDTACTHVCIIYACTYVRMQRHTRAKQLCISTFIHTHACLQCQVASIYMWPCCKPEAGCRKMSCMRLERPKPAALSQHS